MYELNLKYKHGDDFNLTLGRNINRYVSSVGMIDGIQAEKSFGKYTAGVIAGSRPDFNNSGFNLKLFGYGGFISRKDSLFSGYMENTLALFEQTNNFKTDRRFLYFQHSGSLVRNLYSFASTELDLYQLKNNNAQNKLSLTNFYTMMRYSPIRALSFYISYDARRNVLYYQTFKSYVDSLSSNNLRHGLRGGISLRPFSNIFINANSGYNYRTGDPQPSRNYNLSLTYSSIPLLNISANALFTRISGSYVKGNTYGIKFRKYISFNSTSLMLGYTKIRYNYTSGFGNLDQDVGTAEVYTRITGDLFFSIYYEGIFEKKNTSSRVFSGINFRF